MNENTKNSIRTFEENLVCVKAMIFKRENPSGIDSYATVLCTVPKEDFGKTNLCRYANGKIHPDSFGTFIRAIGFELISPSKATCLSSYERYLEKNGWKFVTTVKSAVGKPKSCAFEHGRMMIECIESIRGKV